MGSCISKCKPKRTQSLYDLRNVNTNTNNNQIQDKLVISSSQIVKPPNNIPVLSKNYKISPSPSIPSFKYDFSSASFYTTTTTNSTTTSESSLSSVSSTASSSILSAKDRSFSNEFLWSCLKENPHVIRINSIKEAGLALAKPTNDNIIQAPNAAFHSRIKQPNIPPRILHSSTISNNAPQKRLRSSSPINSSSISTRQKSFRSSPTDFFLSSRTALRSPSPSRRFSRDSRAFNTSPKESGLKRVSSSGTTTKVNPVQNSASPFSYSLRKDNRFIRAASPVSGRLRPGLGNRETCTHRIVSKIDEVAVKEALADDRERDDAVPMEDIDNPHISLDCFIFL